MGSLEIADLEGKEGGVLANQAPAGNGPKTSPVWGDRNALDVSPCESSKNGKPFPERQSLERGR